MMSYQGPPQRKLFYIGINLDKRIKKNHSMRKIRELIDFDFIYKEVKGKYGYKWERINPSTGNTQIDAAFGSIQREVGEGINVKR
ncbi:MAG TPA: hypothetical protein VNN20_11020 [Thermodesulfobacteriota bacterium]|nr:hypothetical protein [Thermodesulfobacteriota bacterium]